MNLISPQYDNEKRTNFKATLTNGVQQAAETLSEPQDIKDFLKQTLSPEEVNQYGIMIPSQMTKLYNNPEKRAFVEYFIEQEAKNANQSPNERKGTANLRRDFLTTQTKTIWEQLSKENIDFENFKIYVQLLFILKERHTGGPLNETVYHCPTIPTDPEFYKPFKNGVLEQILELPQKGKSDFLWSFLQLRNKYIRTAENPNIRESVRFKRDDYEKLFEKLNIQTNNNNPQCIPLSREQLEQFYQNKFSKDEVQDYINTPDFKPTYLLTYGKRQRYLSKKYQNDDYEEMVGYTKDSQGKITVRLFYKSHSEGIWRSSPNTDGGRRDKGESIPNSSYETTTKVDLGISERLDQLPLNDQADTDIRTIETIRINKNQKQTLKEDIQAETQIPEKLFPSLDLPIGCIDFFCESTPIQSNGKKVYPQRYYQAVINDYNHLVPQGLDYTNMKKIDKKYHYKHVYLGEIETEVYRTTYKNKNVDIYFSHPTENDKEPNKIRIENIIYSDDQINSFGIHSHQINLGPFSMKPVEYSHLCPEGREGTPYGYRRGRTQNAPYKDIRDLYQNTPIIQHYKTINHLK